MVILDLFSPSITHSLVALLPIHEQPPFFPVNEEAVGLAACFWIAALYALYGKLYQLEYPKFKINILDLLFFGMETWIQNVNYTSV